MATNQCDVNDSKLQLSSDPRDVISVVGGNSIEVVETKTSDKLIFTVNYREYVAPTITSNSGIYKVGVTVPSFKFDASFNKGSEEFVTQTMTPSKGLDLSVPFTWTESNITGTDVGLWPRYDGVPTLLHAVDTKGTVVQKPVGIEYRFLHYCGFTTKDSLTEAEIKQLVNRTDLLTSIKSKYASYVYNYSTMPTYIYWVFPFGADTITEASEGPLPVPLKLDLPNVLITDEGVPKLYRVVRTAVKTKFVNATILLK